MIHIYPDEMNRRHDQHNRILHKFEQNICQTVFVSQVLNLAIYAACAVSACHISAHRVRINSVA